MSKHALKMALWVGGRTMALIVFVTVSLTSCGTAYVAASSIFHPEQTNFPGNSPPEYFLVVVEEPHAGTEVAQHRVLAWKYAQEILAKEPQRARLSIQKGPRFRVLEEGQSYQVVQARHTETEYVTATYRVENGRIIPLSYKTDGGIIFFGKMVPVYILGLWLGLISARRFLKYFIARTAGQAVT